MVRNATESVFWSIQNGRRWPFCEKNPINLKLRIDLKLREMQSKVVFGHPKWLSVAILLRKSKENRSCVLI